MIAVGREVRPTARSVRAESLVLAAVAAVGIALRLRQFLSGRSLWLDEILLSENLADVGFPEILTEPLRNHQSAPPGFLVLARTIVKLFGASDVVLRLVPLCAGVATVLLAVVVSRRLLHRSVARVAFVALVALSPALTYYATEAKQYAVEVLAAMGVLVLWSLRTSRRAAWWFAVVGLAIALLSLSGLIALVGLALALAVEQLVPRLRATAGDRAAQAQVLGRACRRWWPAGVLWFLGFTLHGLYTLGAGVDRSFMQQWWAVYDAFPPTPANTVAGFGWYPTWLMRLAWVGVGERGPVEATADPAPLVAFALVAVLMALVLWRRRDLRLLFGCTFPIAVALALLQLYPTSGRLSLYAVPYVFLGIAAGVDTALERRHRLEGPLAVAAVGVILVAQLTVAAPLVARPYDARDARWAIEQVLERFEPGDAIVFERTGQRADWYLRGVELDDGAIYTIDLDELVTVERLTDPDLAAHRRLWIVSTHRIPRSQWLAAKLGPTAGFATVCTVSPSEETYLALLVRRGGGNLRDSATTCPTPEG